MRSDIVSLHKIDQAVIDRKIILTPFEEGFLENIRNRVESQSGELSRKQRQILGKDPGQNSQVVTNGVVFWAQLMHTALRPGRNRMEV